MQDNFDEIEENKGGTKQPFVPFEKAWAALQPELDKEAARRKRKRRFLFFWLSFIAVALIGGLVVLKNGKPVANSFTKTAAGNKPTPNALVLAVPLVVGKSLVMKNHSINKSKNIDAISPYEKWSKQAHYREVVASATASSIFNPKKKTIINETNNDATKQEVATKDGKDATGIQEEKNKDFAIAKPTITSDSAASQKTDSAKAAVAVTDKKKPKKPSRFHFGLQFDVPLHAGVNSLDVNGQREPFSLLIPEVWASINLSKKQNVLFLFSPYSQYYLNNRNAISYNQYQVTIQHATAVNQGPEQINYTQTVALNKLIAVQASMLYQYQASNKIKLGAGISTNFLESALLENKITKNNAQVTKDSLYGIDKKSKEWSALKQNFLTGRIEGAYLFKNIEVGADIIAPVDRVLNEKINKTSWINTNVFLRWQFK